MTDPVLTDVAKGVAVTAFASPAVGRIVTFVRSRRDALPRRRSRH